MEEVVEGVEQKTFVWSGATLFKHGFLICILGFSRCGILPGGSICLDLVGLGSIGRQMYVWWGFPVGIEGGPF